MASVIRCASDSFIFKIKNQMKKVLWLGIMTTGIVLMAGCHAVHEERVIDDRVFIYGKVTRVDTLGGYMLLDTGKVRNGADVALSGDISGSSILRGVKKNDFVVLAQDSITKKTYPTVLIQ